MKLTLNALAQNVIFLIAVDLNLRNFLAQTQLNLAQQPPRLMQRD